LDLNASALRRFGEYELLEEIGRGGMGVVYKARQASLQRVVALKMLMFGPLAGTTAVRRFRAEAVAAAGLQHPNIVAVHEVGVHADQHYLVMEYVQGETLDRIIENKPLPAKRAAGYVKEIAQAIHFAHENGILHRDLKPSNILIDTTDQPRITDFGLAKRFSSTGSEILGTRDLTVTGQIIGSPGYMAPEQAAVKHGPTTRATDVYALGAILYHLLTGRPPFGGESLAEALQQILSNEPVRPGLLNAGVPRDLETICIKCLEKAPAKRYATARLLAEELGRFLSGEPVQARPVTQVERARRWCQRRPAIASLAGTTMLLLLAVLIGSPLAVSRIARERLLAEQQLYVADMNVAHQAWQEGDLQRAQTLLRAHLPPAHRQDLRGFEWRYLWKLCQDESRFQFTNFPDWVSSVVASPDRRLIAAAGGHTVKLLNLDTGQEIGQLSDPEFNVGCASFSPVAGSLLAVGGGPRGLVKIWNLTRREVVAIFNGNSSDIGSIDFSPDGKLLGSITHRTVSMWDVKSQTNLWIRQTSVPAGALLFTRDGTKVISGGGESGNLLVWDAATGADLERFPLVHQGWIEGIAWAPDSQMLATCGEDSRIVLWDFSQRKPLATLLGHGGRVMAVAFSPDGRWLASAGGDNTVRVWDVSSRKQVAMLRGHLGAVNSLLFLSGTTIVSAGSDHTVRVWEFNQTHQESILPGETWLSSLAVSPDGSLLAATAYHSNSTALWDISGRRLMTNFIGHTAPVWCAAFSPNGHLLATGSEDYTVKLWDLLSLAPVGSLTNRFETGSIAFSADGKILATAGLTFNSITEETNRLAFWDLASRTVLPLLPQARPMASAVAFANNGRFLATGHFDGWVRLWDLTRTKLLAQFRTHPGLVFCVTFSQDSALLASSGLDSNVILYDVAKGRVFKTLKGHASDVWSVSFDPDGRTLASAGYDGTIKLWNLATQEPALTLKQRLGPVDGVAFSPAGGLLVSCGTDGDVWLWRATSAAEVR
jgi:WD40 repeat protein/tRNA A-37 threonylcarbamoyl transferase component Bud32